MITDEQKYENQMKYLELLGRLNIDLTALTQYLNKIDYFNAPASTQYNRAYSGGLCELALKTCFELGNLCNQFFPGKYSESDIIKVALLGNLYRAEMYESYSKNTKNESTGQWETELAYRTKEDRMSFGNIGFSSYMRIKNLLPLTDEQIMAICLMTNTENGTIDSRLIKKTFPLVVLAQTAFEAANYF